MMDLTEDERLLALSLWVGVVLFSAILYLTGSYSKAILIGIFVLISCLLGFGRRWLLRGSFAVAIVAIAVALGAPSPDQWSQLLQDARRALFAWIPG
jgi:O-antigen ligase